MYQAVSCVVFGVLTIATKTMCVLKFSRTRTIKKYYNDYYNSDDMQ